MTSKNSRENAAANAVVAHLAPILGVEMTARRWDDGSANGMHDFYLEGGGHRIALEVTTIANGQRVGRDVRWAREAPDGWVAVEGLTGCWIAYLEGDGEATEVARAIRTQLPQLEALDVMRVDTRSWQEHAFAPDSLRRLGYEQARALNMVGIVQASCVEDASEALAKDHGGQVQVLRGFGVSRPADHNFPLTVIDEQLREPDLHQSDVKKLLAVSDATARHLWMWVELEEGLAMIRSFEAEGLPDADLDVDGIDGVWVGRSPVPGVLTGYSWLRGRGWSEFSCPRDEVVDN